MVTPNPAAELPTRLASLTIRATISQAMEPGALARFDERRHRFAREYARLSSHGERARFECLLGYLYTGCETGHVEVDPCSGREMPFFPAAGNLDSGDAAAEPFPPALESAQAALRDPAATRAYRGPEPGPELTAAVRQFLASRGFVEPRRASRLAVVPGQGTVHLYDCVVRVLARRPGDVILADAPTYGFFVPQPERSRARLATLGRGRRVGVPLTPGDLDAAITNRNQALKAQWRRGLVPQVLLVLSDACRLDPADCRARRTARAVSAAVDRLAADAPPDEVDRVVRQVLNTAAAGLLPEGWWDDPRLPVPSPPRVVAFLLINPDVAGTLYGPDDLAALATVLERHGVAAIEDLAYHHLAWEPGTRAASLQNVYGLAYTLVGLSKPLALAGLRIGALVAPPELAAPIVRVVENSVGFVAPVAQSAACGAFAPEHGPELDAYFARNALAYRDRRELMLAALEGVDGPHVPGGRREILAAELERHAFGLFERKQSQGVEIFDPATFPASDPGGFRRTAVSSFVEGGLARFFRVAASGDSGFFILVDSAPLLDLAPISGIALGSSAEVAALLFEVFGVRSIPEEGLGPVSSGTRPSLLRLSFAPEAELIVQALFTVFLGLSCLSSNGTS